MAPGLLEDEATEPSDKEESYEPSTSQNVLHREKVYFALLPPNAADFACYAGYHEKLISDAEIREYQRLETESMPNIKADAALKKAERKAKRPYQKIWEDNKFVMERKQDGRLWTCDYLSGLTSRTLGYKNLAVKQLLLCRPSVGKDGHSQAIQLWPVLGGVKEDDDVGTSFSGSIPLHSRWDMQNPEVWEQDTLRLPEDPTRDDEFLRKFRHQLLVEEASDPNDIVRKVFWAQLGSDSLSFEGSDTFNAFVRQNIVKEDGKHVPFFVQILLEREGWQQYAWSLDSPGFVQVQIPSMSWGDARYYARFEGGSQELYDAVLDVSSSTTTGTTSVGKALERSTAGYVTVRRDVQVPDSSLNVQAGDQISKINGQSTLQMDDKTILEKLKMKETLELDMCKMIKPGMILYGRNWRKQYDRKYNSMKDRPQREQDLVKQLSDAVIAKVSVHEDPFSGGELDGEGHSPLAHLIRHLENKMFVSHSFAVIEFKEDERTGVKPPALALEYRWRHSTQYPFSRVPIELGAEPNTIWGSNAKHPVMEIPAEIRLPTPSVFADLRLIPLINLPLLTEEEADLTLGVDKRYESNEARSCVSRSPQSRNSQPRGSLSRSVASFEFQNEDRAVYTSEEFARWRKAARGWFKQPMFDYNNEKETTPAAPALPTVRVDDGVIGASASGVGLRPDISVDMWQVWWNWNDQYGGRGFMHKLAQKNPIRRAACPWMTMRECEQDIQRYTVDTAEAREMVVSVNDGGDESSADGATDCGASTSASTSVDVAVTIKKEDVKRFIVERQIQLHIKQDQQGKQVIPLLFGSAIEALEWIRAVLSYGVADNSTEKWTFPTLVEAGLTYMKNSVKGGAAKRDRFAVKDAAGNLYGSGYYNKLSLSCHTVATDVFRSITGKPANIPTYSTIVKKTMAKRIGGVHYKEHKGWFALPGVLESVFNYADKDGDNRLSLKDMCGELTRIMQSIPEHAVELHLAKYADEGNGKIELTDFGSTALANMFSQMNKAGNGFVTLQVVKSSRFFSHYRGMSAAVWTKPQILQSRKDLLTMLVKLTGSATPVNERSSAASGYPSSA